MSANSPVFVQVVVRKVEWREVEAVTLDEAREIASQEGDVAEVIRADWISRHPFVSDNRGELECAKCGDSLFHPNHTEQSRAGRR
jgi:hypothetical protein